MCAVALTYHHLQLTKPVFEMLDRVEGIGSTDLVNAQALVANMSSSVQKMSNSIQSATVEQVDRFQSNYLGTRASSSNATAAAATSGTDNLVKAMHTVYYVSADGGLSPECVAKTQQLQRTWVQMWQLKFCVLRRQQLSGNCVQCCLA